MNMAQNKILDAEFRGSEEDHQALRLWLRLLTCTNMIENKLRNHLRREFGCTLPRFDMLAQLERHPQGLSMGELSQLMMVSAGNVTGISTQLEKEGLIKREVSHRDRRSFTLFLTQSGEQLISKMMESYESCLSEILQLIPDEGFRSMMENLGQLKRKMQAGDYSAPQLTSV